MYYLIDGYNLFFRLDGKVDPLDESREEFITSLRRLMSEATLTGGVVFDSHNDHANDYPSRSERSPLEILYAPTNLEADDMIIEYISHQKEPHRITTVTSDNDLARRAKELGSRTMKSEAFISYLLKKRKRPEYVEKPQRESIVSIDRLEELFEKRFKKLLDESE